MPTPSIWVDPPESDRFVEALLDIDELKDAEHSYRGLLRALYSASADLSTQEILPLVFPNEKKDPRSIDGQLKSLGNRILKRLTGGRPPKVQPLLDGNTDYSWAAIASCYRSNGLIRYSLLEQLREALEQLNWVAHNDAAQIETPEASDIAPPERAATTVYRTLRDTALARRVKQIHNWECQICGHFIVLPDGSRYAEVHHIQPLGQPHDGKDVESNVMCVCPNHHAELDYGVRRIDVSGLRIREGHVIGPAYVDYHNGEIFGRVNC